jgi:GntR family phosphonate transport system transcriptional regulator
MTMRAIATDGGQDGRAQASATAGVSLWRRIADEIEHAIARGSFSPGSKLPGETEIAGRFGVNRHTVRRALAALAARGLVRAERGSGTYVEPSRIAYPIRPRTRFTEIVGGAGRSVGGRLIASAVEPADAHVAQRLRLRAGAPVVRLELVRLADRVPISAATSWLAAERFAGAPRVYAAVKSMTRTLAHFGVRDYARKSTHVAAAIADAAEAARLKVALGRPILIVESVDVDGEGRPVLTTRARFAADRLELVIET